MCSLHKERFCYRNITCLDIYLTVLFWLTIFYYLPYHIFTDISSDIIVIYYFYLTKTNLLLFDIPTKFMINKEKKLPWWFVCVCYALKNLFPKMAFCNVLPKRSQKYFLDANYAKRLISQFWENFVSFNFLANVLTI